MKISKNKQDFIDAHFNEADNPTREEFEKLTTAEELHYLALNHNWDCGVEVVQWIIESNLCSEATALMIFWLARPEYYTEYRWDAKEIPQYLDIEVFDLIRTIVEKYKKGFYKKTSIAYNPKEDMPENIIVPDIMFQATKGEEPYIYYEKDEILSWFGEYLYNQIYRCDNAIDLFNIASLLGYNGTIKTYEQIINHPFCDKGVALMVFWHLKTQLDDIQVDILDEIIRRFNNNEYVEVLRYDPKEDTEVKIQRKEKWKIPDDMKKAIN